METTNSATATNIGEMDADQLRDLLATASHSMDALYDPASGWDQSATYMWWAEIEGAALSHLAARG